jgi:hypothetical protein
LFLLLERFHFVKRELKNLLFNHNIKNSHELYLEIEKKFKKGKQLNSKTVKKESGRNSSRNVFLAQKGTRRNERNSFSQGLLGIPNRHEKPLLLL